MMPEVPPWIYGLREAAMLAVTTHVLALSTVFQNLLGARGLISLRKGIPAHGDSLATTWGHSTRTPAYRIPASVAKC